MMDSKNVFQTKTFWFQVLSVVFIALWNYFIPDHQINQAISMGAQAAVATGTRLATNQPAHLLPRA
jgi:hypothetical protein